MSDPYRLKHYLLDHEGEVIWTYDVFLWAEWMEWAYRQVDQKAIGPFRVSTVFIGCNYSYGDGPPKLWETMIFGTGWDNYWEARATSVQHARLQHRIGCWRAKRMLH